MRPIPRLIPILLILALTPFLMAGKGGRDDDRHQPYVGKILKELARDIEDLDERITALEECGCAGVLEPVCGDNQRTYINACEAECSGAGVIKVGFCKYPVCGGDTALTCEDGNYCEVPAGSCDDDEVGRCMMQPQICTREYAPVCGCDGTTYGNDCERRAAGVSLEHDGECSDDCYDSDDCNEGEFCNKRMDSCDQEGVCQTIPQICTLEYDPVCGCDGATYSNSCAANSAGTTVEHRGACDKVEICHIPPGNHSRKHTIEVDPSAVPAHLAHGDYLGECRNDHEKHQKHQKHQKHKKDKKDKKPKKQQDDD